MLEAFVYETMPVRIRFGAGSSREHLIDELDRLGVSRVLLIASRRDDALVDSLTDQLGSRLAGTFREVKPHVPVEVALKARETSHAVQADCLVSVGGGSATGTAKAIALDTRLPIIAIPTTYAGSEATPVWGLTESGRKTTGRAAIVKPRVILYDPDLTLSLSPAMTAASAMNALAHAVEAFYAPGANPVTSLKAEAAVKIIGHNLKAVVDEPQRLETRSMLLYGAFLAGEVFAEAGSGLHHKICHVLGGAFNLPHAETHTVLLPQVMAYNQPAMPAIAGRIAAALGHQDAAQSLYSLVQDIGAPVALSQLGLTREQLEQAIRLLDAEMLPANPRPIGPQAIQTILEGAYEGRSPA